MIHSNIGRETTIVAECHNLLYVERSRHALHNMRLEYGHASNPHVAVESSSTNAIARRQEYATSKSISPGGIGCANGVLPCQLGLGVTIVQFPSETPEFYYSVILLHFET
jgi:hypothetical protein